MLYFTPASSIFSQNRPHQFVFQHAKKGKIELISGAHVKKCVYYSMEEEYIIIKIKKKDLERLIALLEKLGAQL